jgi:hypothetical protein
VNELRYKVRHLKPHTDLTGTDFDFHEWIQQMERPLLEHRDALGRRGNGSRNVRWYYWRCNNFDCGALALVSETAIEKVVQWWLET